MRNRDVLISGASVAGPDLAYWLDRFGFRPTIVERAPAPRAGGYAIDLRGAAVKVADQMGILPQVRQAGIAMRGMSYVDHRGRPLVTIRIDRLRRGGPDGDVEIMRGDLTRILYDATCATTEYIFDDAITRLTAHEDGVDVEFERGAPRRFDLVVGTDGLHSNVRALAFGDESQFSTYLGYHLAIFTAPNFLQLDHFAHVYNMPGKMVGATSANEQDELKAIFAFASPPIHYDHRDDGEQMRILAGAFADTGWQASRLLEAMWDAPDYYFDSITQIRMDRWSQGRVVLVGDAGYGPSPLSGQGTSLALVGSYVLAGDLKAASGDHSVAFAAYEREMRDFVEQNQRLALFGARLLVPKRHWQIWLRNALLRVVSRLPADRLPANRIQQAANAITLKDYDDAG